MHDFYIIGYELWPNYADHEGNFFWNTACVHVSVTLAYLPKVYYSRFKTTLDMELLPVVVKPVVNW